VQAQDTTKIEYWKQKAEEEKAYAEYLSNTVDEFEEGLRGFQKAMEQSSEFHMQRETKLMEENMELKYEIEELKKANNELNEGIEVEVQDTTSIEYWKETADYWKTLSNHWEKSHKKLLDTVEKAGREAAKERYETEKELNTQIEGYLKVIEDQKQIIKELKELIKN